MTFIPNSNYVRCYFRNNVQHIKRHFSSGIDIYFGETKNLGTRLPLLKNFISDEEKLRADKFHSTADSFTYILCHALLRLILARKLNINPLDLSFKNGIDNKPSLTGNRQYFNLSHTREAFIIGCSGDFHLGIDLEKINHRVNIIAVTKSFFSQKDRNFIFKSESDARENFSLLWTRKESLLKAIGSGMINDLDQITVSEKENYIKKELFNELFYGNLLNEYYIYSIKLKEYFLSIAIPYESSITLYELNEDFTDNLINLD